MNIMKAVVTSTKKIKVEGLSQAGGDLEVTEHYRSQISLENGYVGQYKERADLQEGDTVVMVCESEPKSNTSNILAYYNLSNKKIAPKRSSLLEDFWLAAFVLLISTYIIASSRDPIVLIISVAMLGLGFYFSYDSFKRRQKKNSSLNRLEAYLRANP